MRREIWILVTAMCVSFGTLNVVHSQQNTPAQRPNAARSANPVLAPIEDKQGLPRVLLIGDSISMGYTLAVREKLKDVANVHRIPTNGGPTTNGLKQLKTWLGNSKWDVIHFNWGLHDLKFILDDPSKLVDPKTEGSHHQVPIAEYEKNLRELVSQLKSTGAKLIWCSTTPVPEGAAGRIPGDEVKYNAVAAKIMKDFDIPIDDLYTHALKENNIQRPANVHYDAKGSEYLALKVAAEIKNQLPR